MDRNSPPFYIEETDDGCREMEDFVQHVLGMTAVGQEHLTACLEENGNIVLVHLFCNNLFICLYVCMCVGVNRKSILDRVDTPRVLPIITPRFVPTCSGKMMKKLGP